MLYPGLEFLGHVVWVYPFTGQYGPLTFSEVKEVAMVWLISFAVPVKSRHNLLGTNVDSILHVTKVAAGFHHIDLTRCRPKTVGVVTRQKPDSYK